MSMFLLALIKAQLSMMAPLFLSVSLFMADFEQEFAEGQFEVIPEEQFDAIPPDDDDE